MRLHETRQIDRPLEEVFGYVADFSNLADWDPGISSSRAIGDDAPAVGTKYEVVASFGSREIPMQYEITELEPNRRVVLIGTGKPLDAVDTIVFESRNGGTWVDYTADFAFKGLIRFLAPLMSPLMNRVGQRAVDGMVQALSR